MPSCRRATTTEVGRRRRRRRAWVALAAVMAMAGCNDASVADQRSDAARDAAVDAGLDEDVADFLALAARGATARYRATFTGIDRADAVVVTSRSPDLRVDVMSESTMVASQVTVDGSSYRCVPGDGTDGPLRCEETDTAPSSPGSLDEDATADLTASLAERMEDYTFEIRTSAMAGIDATCLVTTLRADRQRADLGEVGTLCVSPEGVVLRVDSGDTKLEATDYTTDVADDAFELPGE